MPDAPTAVRLAELVEVELPAAWVTARAADTPAAYDHLARLADEVREHAITAARAANRSPGPSR